jgi:FlaA1/EpsC-like NDP-sugar epimerase
MAHAAVFAGSACAAFLLRFDFSLPRLYGGVMLGSAAVWMAAKLVAFHLVKADRGWWRYVSVADALRIGAGNLLGSAIGGAVIVLIWGATFPRSIYLLDLLVCLLATVGMRVAARLRSEWASEGREGDEVKNALIYGAGDAGVTLLREIRGNRKLPYRVKGFLDDQKQKHGVTLLGAPVLGGGDEAAAVARKHGVDIILIAIPSASGADMTRILERCRQAEVECMTIPGLGEIIEDGGLAGQIRDVAVEDLLGRTPVRLDQSGIRAAVAGNVVLVTGAAGSIGSELCRQIARFGPAKIVGFEIAESPLFEIDREMRAAFPDVPFCAEIGSVQSRVRLNEVFGRHKPAVVYHAAAYKHVPLMEDHVFEAIENNVFGTYNLATVAARHGVRDFVLISSDKAVRPTNVMGATKRIAELLLVCLQNEGVKFVSVRFGNVLGSNGSVIPIFKKQIAAGGPVTVTHPDMRRFFMTIPEACQLVLQAAAIGEAGQICVLDMGQPVRIADLARNLIALSGLKPDQDIKIEFTGARPGEKLYEELSSLLEDTVPTTHEKIRIFVGNEPPGGDLGAWLDELRDVCARRDVGRLVIALKDIVVDYSPSSYLLRRVVGERESQPAMAEA